MTAPTLTNLNGDAGFFTEGGTITRLDAGGNATVADAGHANFNGGTLTVAISANRVAGEDVLGIVNEGTGAGQIGVSGTDVTYQGVVIGTFTGGTGTSNLVIIFDADATIAATQALVRALTYNNTNTGDPSTASRTIQITLTDGQGGTSAVQSVTVGITGVNDAPINVVPGTPVAALEDGPAVTVTGLSVSDIEANPASEDIRVTLSVTDGVLTINTSVVNGLTAADVTGDGTDTVVLTGTQNQINATFGNATGVQFQSTTPDASGAVTLTVVTNDLGLSGNDSGMTGTGTSEADTDTVTINVTAVNDAPQGTDDERTMAEGGTYTFLTTDFAFFDSDGDSFSGVVVTTVPANGTIQRFSGGMAVATLAAGDTFTAADLAAGNIRYTPSNPDNSGTPFDTFTFQVIDNGGTANGGVDRDQSANTFTFNVNPVDDAPVARDDSFSAVETTVLTGNVFADNGSGFENGPGADSDVDGPALTVSAVNGVAASVGTQITLGSGALLTVNADGTFAYDPNGAFEPVPNPSSGAVPFAFDSFTYTLAGGSTATVQLTVGGVDNNDIVRGKFGASGDETLSGGVGNDLVEAYGGNDILNGGIGDDILLGGAGNDALNGGDGSDTADYSTAAAGVDARLNRNVASNDGDGGSDTFTGLENLTGSAFNDILVGNAVGNILTGGAGFDQLIGLGGNDTLDGGAGTANEVHGGLGDDTYVVTANDTVVELAGQGTDLVQTSNASHTLAANVENLTYTGAGAFTGRGNALANVLRGGAGNDVLSGRGGNDTFFGEGGSDTVDYSLAAGGVTAFLGTGATDDGDGAADTFIGIENLRGSGFADLLYGDAQANVLDGGLGNDTLVGRAGNDTLRGGAGNDTADYSDATSGIFARLSTGVVNDGEGGTDFVVSIENVNGGGSDDVVIGSSLDNSIAGGEGRDQLIGGGGNDTLRGGTGVANELIGGLGDDTYVLDANDTIEELAGQGTDTIQTSRAFQGMAANVENLAYTGGGNFNGVGNGLANVITGGAGLDTLVGGGGNDTLNGGDGSDLAQMSGLLADYVITDLGGGSFTIADSVGARDGTDTLNGIERVRFSNGQVITLGGAPAPLPSDKDADGPQVLPGLTDDDFVLAKVGDEPLVLPGADGDGPADTVFDRLDLPPQPAGHMAEVCADGFPAGHANEVGRLNDPDGWLF